MNKIALFAAACGLGAGAMLACSSDEPAPAPGGSGGAESDASFARDGSTYDSAVSPESGLGELMFRPDKVYTGVDGTRVFKLPIAVYDSDADLTVTSSDSSAMVIANASLKNPVSPDGVVDNGKYFLITALKAGSFTLTARSAGRSATAAVTVTAYASDRYAAGEARYNSNVTTATADRGCKVCHVNGSSIDQSPAALATATDQEIGMMITSGVKPGPQVIKIPSEPGTPHKWQATANELTGLVTFLRALEPRGFQ